MKSLVITTILAAALSLTSAAQTITTFSVPGAGISNAQGTFPSAINRNGQVAGYYTDSQSVAHGFTYTNGLITTFNAFGAASYYTVPTGLSTNGSIIGYFQFPTLRQSGVVFGFLRSPAGSFTLIQAAIGPDIFTYPFAISDTGIITGGWFDAASSNPFHSYVRDAKGTITTFDCPNNVGGTFAKSVNARGQVTGLCQDAIGVHGFLRDAAGNLTVFDVPGSIGTYGWSINAGGQIAGYYIDSNSVDQGFVRNVDGSFTTFTVPGAVQLFSTEGFEPVVMNDFGEVSGVAVLASGETVSYTRSATGVIREFQVSGDSTTVTGINGAGHLTGLYQIPLSQGGSYNGFVF